MIQDWPVELGDLHRDLQDFNSQRSWKNFLEQWSWNRKYWFEPVFKSYQKQNFQNLGNWRKGACRGSSQLLRQNSSMTSADLHLMDVDYIPEKLLEIYERTSGEFDYLCDEESKDFTLQIELTKDESAVYLNIVPPKIKKNHWLKSGSSRRSRKRELPGECWRKTSRRWFLKKSISSRPWSPAAGYPSTARTVTRKSLPPKGLLREASSISGTTPGVKEGRTDQDDSPPPEKTDLPSQK